MKKQRIALDMDEVIADVIPKFKYLYERDLQIPLREEDYLGKKIYDLPNARHIRNYLQEPGFFADLPLMPDSQEVVRELSEQYDIYIVTAAMEFRNSLQEKYDWLRQHFPFISWRNMVLCGDKSIITAEYMIDDHVRNIANFQGIGLLYTASHNVHEHRFTRVNNWQEIRQYFSKLNPISTTD